MKLAILAQSYLHDKTAKINGTLVQQHNLAHGFEKSGIEVHYIATTQDKSKKNYEVENGIHFHWIQSQNGIFEWKHTMVFYKSILESMSPDAVYVRGRNVLQYVAGTYAKLHNIPYVWGTNGEDSAEFWKNVKRLKQKQKSFIRKVGLLPFKAYEDIYINKGMKLSKVVVNQSLFQQQSTKRILNKEGIVLPSYFLPIENSIEKKNQILWLANLSKGKQPEVFIELVKNLDLKSWETILAGGTTDTNYKNNIEALASSLNITMPGKIEFKDSFNYYQNAKIYVNTSKPNADGLPNAYIQSWLSGTVVFSLHHDPNNWMEDYKIGFCANGDIDIFVNELQALIENDKKLLAMSDNATKFAQNKFSSASIIENYIMLFKGSI